MEPGGTKACEAWPGVAGLGQRRALGAFFTSSSAASGRQHPGRPVKF